MTEESGETARIAEIRERLRTIRHANDFMRLAQDLPYCNGWYEKDIEYLLSLLSPSGDATGWQPTHLRAVIEDYISARFALIDSITPNEENRILKEELAAARNELQLFSEHLAKHTPRPIGRPDDGKEEP